MIRSKEIAQKQIRHLTELLNQLNRQYHTEGISTVDDSDYDWAYRQLFLLESAHPDLRLQDSPLTRVGFAPPEDRKQHTHRQKLLSLSNIFNAEELLTFLITTKGALVSAEYKMDGLALSLTYQDRILTCVSTRGDGFTGEDITYIGSHIPYIPHELKWLPMGTFEIHGEAYLPKAGLELINTRRVQNGESPYTTTRNAAAGILRRLEVDESIQQMEFTPYGCDQSLIEALGLTGYWTLLDFFRKSFSLVTKPTIFESWEGLQKYYIEVEQKTRSELPFDIDGLVIKILDMCKREEMGVNSREPLWATAYKFTSQLAVTPLLDIEWGVGRTGRLTPVALLKPVNIGGVTVSRCTLHNWVQLKSLGVTINGNVTIVRSGDVIPKIVHCAATEESAPVEPPTQCPSCNNEVTLDNKGISYICTNSAKCTAQIAGTIISFCSRKYMNINGLGDKLIENLVEQGYVKSYADLYHLDTKRDEVITKLNLSVKVFDKVLKAIDDSRDTSFTKFLGSLGIEGFGRTLAPIVTSQFDTFEEILEMDSQELSNKLMGCDGLGTVIVKNFVEYVASNKELYYHAKLGGLHLTKGSK